MGKRIAVNRWETSIPLTKCYISYYRILLWILPSNYRGERREITSHKRVYYAYFSLIIISILLFGINLKNSGSKYSLNFFYPIQNALPIDIPISSDSEEPYILNYSSYLGGLYSDFGYDIAVADSGEYYVTGYTRCSDFPLMNPIYSQIHYTEAFITKFNSDDTLNFSTFYGGSYYDFAYSIALDSYGACYITGYTQSSDFPTINSFDDTYNEF